MEEEGYLEQIRRHQILEESKLREMCEKVKEIMVEEPNVVNLSPPINVIGDIHGQFYDFLNIFKLAGEVRDGKTFLFLGDYVDRGHYSVETIEYLIVLKILYRDRILLLRGNHEMRQITMTYGFFDECRSKYGSSNAWNYLCDVFDYMPIAAIVGGQIMGVHGGLSPDLSSLDFIQTLERRHEIQNTGTLADLLWSDPEEGLTTGFERNPRGCGYIFGGNVTSQFCHWNDLTLICRAHQLAQSGFKYFFENKNCVIVWSAPNYCYREKNLATILSVDVNLKKTYTQYKDVAEEGPKQDYLM